MTKPIGSRVDTLPTAAQARIEREAAEIIVENVSNSLRELGNAGVSDPETSQELLMHLEAGLAATYRWLAETQINQEALSRKKR